MRKNSGLAAAVFAAVFATLLLSGCGYNDLQRQDEQVKSAWSEVVNQYQRRADLVPNLVNTVKGYAAQEQQVLTEVTNARASVGSIKATPELLNDPAAFAKFQAAQGELQSALSRLLRRRGKLSAIEVGRAVPRPELRSSKAPRIGSPSRATASSRRCRSSTPRFARFRPT